MPTPSLFTWVPRCGGTSVWSWICHHGGERIKSRRNIYVFPDLNVIAVMHWYSDVWRKRVDYHGKKRFVFGFCRDTYTRLESIAAYRGWASLEQFVKRLNGGYCVPMPKYDAGMNFAAPQSRWLAIDGTLAVDFLGEQERLDEDFARLRETLGWPDHPLGHENARARTFSDGWTEDMRKMVQSMYREDFELLGGKA